MSYLHIRRRRYEIKRRHVGRVGAWRPHRGKISLEALALQRGEEVEAWLECADGEALAGIASKGEKFYGESGSSRK